MSLEIKMLLSSLVLGIVQLMAASHTATKQYGMSWNLSPRDEKMPDLRGIAGRMDRAFKNFMQTFPFFAALVLVVEVTEHNSTLSAWGVIIYFVARLVYVPAYLSGIPGPRSMIWLSSLIGMLLLLMACF